MAKDAYNVVDRRPWTAAADKPYSDLAKWVLKDDGTTAQQSPPLDGSVDMRPNLNKARRMYASDLYHRNHLIITELFWNVQFLGIKTEAAQESDQQAVSCKAMGNYKYPIVIRKYTAIWQDSCHPKSTQTEFGTRFLSSSTNWLWATRLPAKKTSWHSRNLGIRGSFIKYKYAQIIW